MRYPIICILLLIGNAGMAQQNDAVTYMSLIDTGDLKKHLYTLASAEMEGRETATEGQRKAAAYIEGHFRKTGLNPGWNGTFQQQFAVYRDSLVRAVLEINGNSLRHDSDFIASRNSGLNVSFSSGMILFVGYGTSDSIQDSYRGVNANGKIVMVMPGAPAVIVKGKRRPGKIPDLKILQEVAQRNGAAALLVVDQRFPRTATPAKGPMYVKHDKTENIINTFLISDSVAKMIMGNDYATVKKIMKSSSPEPKSYVVNTNMILEIHTENLESSNVIGILDGTEKKEEAIVITSHYDHMGKRDSVIFYGADDDASGTVTILEMAEAFTKAAEAGLRPKRSVIFMTVSGEEKGLWGSDYYSRHPAFPMDKTSVNINIDMIGRMEPGRKDDSLNYIYIVGDNRLSSDLRPISEESNKKLYNFTLDYNFNDPNDPQRIFYRSDHYNFAKNGVPAIFYFNGLHDDYHRPTDTPDKINYQLLSKRAHLIFKTAWEMANREEMLKRDLE